MTEPNETQEQFISSEPRGPILYTNASTVVAGAYDLTVSLGCEAYHADSGDDRTRAHIGIVAMSHSHAWVVACMILRQLGAVVQRNGMFAVPAELVERLGLQAEHKDMAALAEKDEE